MKEEIKDMLRLALLGVFLFAGGCIAWAIQFKTEMFGANFISIKDIIGLWFWCLTLSAYLWFVVLIGGLK